MASPLLISHSLDYFCPMADILKMNGWMDVVFTYVCLFVSADVYQGQNRGSDPLSLQLQVVLSSLMWVLRNKPRSSASALPLSHLSSPIVDCYHFKFMFKSMPPLFPDNHA